MKGVKLFIVLLATFLFFAKPPIILADMLTHDTATFFVTYENQKILKPFDARMLQCNKCVEYLEKISFDPFERDCTYDPDIQDSTSDIDKIVINDRARQCYWIPSELAVGGKCYNSTCEFSYMLPSSFRLVVVPPYFVGTYISEPMQFSGSYTGYKVNIVSDKIEIDSLWIGSYISGQLFAVVFTILIEMFIGLIFFMFQKHIFRAIVLANLVTVPVVWFLVTFLNFSIFYAEIIALIAEFFFYTLTYLKGTNKVKLFLYVLVANGASYMLGNAIYILLGDPVYLLKEILVDYILKR
jgi:hypothetical protein